MTRHLLPAITVLTSAMLLLAACGGDDGDGGEGGAGGDATTTTTTTTTTTGAGGAGGGMADCSTVPATGDFPCEVHAIIAARCQSCHSDPPMGYTPMPLMTYEQTREDNGYGTVIWERMGEMLTSESMPPSTATALTAAERQTLLDWVAACAAPAAGAGCE